MKRQDMIDTMRAMGWWPIGRVHLGWVGVSSMRYRMFRERHHRPHEDYEEKPPGTIWGYPTHGRVPRDNDRGLSHWSNLCDDEVLRFYLKIMMEGL